MKNILLFLIGAFTSLQTFAQDPALYKTWHLYELAIDLGPSFYVNTVQPSINPYLTINNDLSFEGYGACNNFMGEFTYDASMETLTTTFFDATLNLCDYPEHDQFEVSYFFYLNQASPQYITLDVHPITNEGELILEWAPGFYARYGTTVLSVSENVTPRFNIFPNPVSDLLFIASEGTTIEKIKVYSISGSQVYQASVDANVIDVSSLSEGLYFLEIFSTEGSSIQKFIKK